jgi:gluconate 2-dehydrogenase gamma chain
MSSKADWKTILEPVDPDSNEPLFFSRDEWNTVEALAARIIPTDHDPGAKEARVVVFIDRYLSGINYVFASADGSGFLEMDGKHAYSWRARISELQQVYRQGIVDVDAASKETYGKNFVDLDADSQDAIMIKISGKPKPASVNLGTTEPSTTFFQFSSDDGLPFWPALCLHVKQGFYADPVYGGNKDRMAWKMIEFDGPKSLKDTMDGTYTTADKFVDDYSWGDLIPALQAQKEYPVPVKSDIIYK